MSLYSYKNNSSVCYNTWLAFFKDNKNAAIAIVEKATGGYVAKWGKIRKWGKTRDQAVAGVIYEIAPSLQVQRWEKAIKEDDFRKTCF